MEMRTKLHRRLDVDPDTDAVRRQGGHGRRTARCVADRSHDMRGPAGHAVGVVAERKAATAGQVPQNELGRFTTSSMLLGSDRTALTRIGFDSDNGTAVPCRTDRNRCAGDSGGRQLEQHVAHGSMIHQALWWRRQRLVGKQ